jgi:acetyl-CoA carboxylase carboxyltransferase component
MANNLAHIGVLGMRWGRRKSRDTGGSESHKRSRVLMKKKLSDMSDDEIKQLSTRLRLEKEYKELTKRNTSAAEKFVTDIMLNATKTTISNLLAKGTTAYAQKLIDYMLGNPVTNGG